MSCTTLDEALFERADVILSAHAERGTSEDGVASRRRTIEAGPGEASCASCSTQGRGNGGWLVVAMTILTTLARRRVLRVNLG